MDYNLMIIKNDFAIQDFYSYVSLPDVSNMDGSADHVSKAMSCSPPTSKLMIEIPPIYGTFGDGGSYCFTDIYSNDYQ